MSCNKFNTSCNKVSTECVDYEGYLPSWTGLDDCNTLTGHIHKIYSELDYFQSLKNLGLDASCLDYNGDYSAVNVLKKHDNKICELLEKVDGFSFLDAPIGDLDVKCLQGVCSNNILTIRDLLQALINKVCSDE